MMISVINMNSNGSWFVPVSPSLSNFQFYISKLYQDFFQPQCTQLFVSHSSDFFTFAGLTGATRSSTPSHFLLLINIIMIPRVLSSVTSCQCWSSPPATTSPSSWSSPQFTTISGLFSPSSSFPTYICYIRLLQICCQ